MLTDHKIRLNKNAIKIKHIDIFIPFSGLIWLAKVFKPVALSTSLSLLSKGNVRAKIKNAFSRNIIRLNHPEENLKGMMKNQAQTIEITTILRKGKSLNRFFL